MLGGCVSLTAHPAQQVPKPIDMLLPVEVRIHPFTGTRTFDEAGGVKGIEVRVEAVNGFGDSTAAFGEFAFELYAFKSGDPDPKGDLIYNWQQSLLDAKQNRVHWDPITRTYVFRLQWHKAIPVGQRFVLTASFSSPFTERLYAEHVFVSGQ